MIQSLSAVSSPLTARASALAGKPNTSARALPLRGCDEGTENVFASAGGNLCLRGWQYRHGGLSQKRAMGSCCPFDRKHSMRLVAALGSRHGIAGSVRPGPLEALYVLRECRGVSTWDRPYRRRGTAPVLPPTAMSAFLSKNRARLSVTKAGSRICAENYYQNPVLSYTYLPALMSVHVTATRVGRLGRQRTCFGHCCAANAATPFSPSSWTAPWPHGGRSYSATAPMPQRPVPSCAGWNQCEMGLGAAVTHRVAPWTSVRLREPRPIMACSSTVEPAAHNGFGAGSNPAGPTNNDRQLTAAV